jgi:hypothetical protein
MEDSLQEKIKRQANEFRMKPLIGANNLCLLMPIKQPSNKSTIKNTLYNYTKLY